MDETTIRNTWMVIATDFRALQRQENTRSRRFHRFPLGEKGLGRLSIHKLGRTIRMVTHVRGGEELVLQFDWDKLESAKSWTKPSSAFQHGSQDHFRETGMERGS
jgi:hypothetical protein